MLMLTQEDNVDHQSPGKTQLNCGDDFFTPNSGEITPIEEFLLAEAVRGSYRITVSGLWHVNPVASFGKTKNHVDVCNEARRFLPLLQMPAHRIKKTKSILREISKVKLWIKRMLSDLKAF